MKYTKKQREYIVMRLKEAKKVLWNGFGSCEPEGKEEFICLALRNYDGHLFIRNDMVQLLIMKRLQGEGTVESWLKDKAMIPARFLTHRKLQQYRHRWVDELIREFSA